MADFQPIDTAPKDGTPIGIWSPREPGVIKIARWGLHLGIKKHPPTWITVTKGLALGNLPTHWIALGPLPGADGVSVPPDQTPTPSHADAESPARGGRQG